MSSVSLGQMRRQTDALKRKYALELAVYRLRPITEEFCLQWAVAVADCQPLPETRPFTQSIVGQGFRFFTLMELHRYLDRCRAEHTQPDCYGIMAALLPAAAASGRLSRALRWDDSAATADPAPLPLSQSLGIQRFAPRHTPPVIEGQYAILNEEENLPPRPEDPSSPSEVTAP